jgi:hypothetical protein
MKKSIIPVLLLICASLLAQTEKEPTIPETVAWLQKKMEMGVLMTKVDFNEKACKLCFSTSSPTSNLTCVILANINPDNISTGENGDGGRGFNLVAKEGLKATVTTSRVKNNYGKEVSSDTHYYFMFDPKANSPTFDAEMVGAMQRLIRKCSQ